MAAGSQSSLAAPAGDDALLRARIAAGAVAASPSPATATAPRFPVADLRHLLAAKDLRTIRTARDLPPVVRARFRERHDAVPGLGIPAAEMDCADPGQPWNVSCTVDSKLPARQLQFAGVAGHHCFVVYDTGGIAHMRHVALFRLQQSRAVVLGIGFVPMERGIGASSVADLRRLLNDPKRTAQLTQLATPADQREKALPGVTGS